MITRVVYFWGVLFGGRAANSANAGFAYANTNNTPSNTNAHISSQLCYILKKSKNLGSCQKINNVNRVLVGLPKIPFEPAKNEK